MQEIACPAPSGDVTVSVESIPFSDLPGQSRLFREYQADPLSLRKYYPTAVASHTDIADRVNDVLKHHTADRSILCEALEDMNRKFGAPQTTLDNIASLREPDCVAVVSGQQSGLFTGPLYTIYKALSAVKMAECLRGRGIKAVPVFWIATEDHDFEEVSKTFVLNSEGRIVELRNQPKRCHEELPVGYIKLDDSIRETIDVLIAELLPTEFSAELRAIVEESWTPQNYFGDAFATQLTSLLGKYGLIMLCPLDSRLKGLASPVYRDAIMRSAEIVEALRKRSDELVADGYQAQVFIGDDYFPLFWQSRDGSRHSLKKSETGTLRTRDGSREFTLDQLAEIAEREPTRFSPSVVLRSVVQDHLLPTVCYFGGAAEIAYFAQSGEVYRVLDRPITPILHRQSFTMVESRHARSLKKYELRFTDLFAGLDSLLPRIVDEYLNADTAGLIAEVEARINSELDRLDLNLAAVDPTLANNLEKRRRKIIYHIESIRNKFRHSQFSRDEVIRRRLETMFAAILPHEHLQERSLNILYFVDRFGTDFVDWIYDSIDLSDKGHRVVSL